MTQKTTYKIEVFTGKDNQTYWRIRHKNGNILATSEGYTDLQTAVTVAANLHAQMTDCVLDIIDDQP
jgi:uncharacterized protein YegP (UPF0339 family)